MRGSSSWRNRTGGTRHVSTLLDEEPFAGLRVAHTTKGEAMAEGVRTIELDASEVALIVGQEGPSMTVRVVAATEDETAEPTEALEIAQALAVRLVEDPEFHDDVLDWLDNRDDMDDDEEDEAEEDGGEEGGGEDGKPPPKPAA